MEREVERSPFSNYDVGECVLAVQLKLMGKQPSRATTCGRNIRRRYDEIANR
jgi:hypothetical protein